MYTFQKNDVFKCDASQIGKMLDPSKEYPARLYLPNWVEIEFLVVFSFNISTFLLSV